MADVKSLTEKKQVVDLLSRVEEGISEELIKSEKDLEGFVHVTPTAVRRTAGLKGSGLNATLLELLGYTLASCDDHPYFMTIIGHTKYSPDYVLRSGQKLLAILDLKAPGISLDDGEGIEQIQSYCRARGDRTAPIGVLFNGRSVRVFINHDYPSFTKYKKLSMQTDTKKKINFYETPVEAADDDIGAIAAVLLKLSVASLSDDPASVARRMGNAKIQTVEEGKWTHEISDRLRAALSEPSDEVIRAIASTDSLWVGMEKGPEPADAVIAWNRRKEAPITVASVQATAKQSINGLLRQRVADACATKGWDDAWSHQIKGLRHRGFGGNGYHLVPPGKGVPLDLHVAGVATGDAKQIILQLENIIKQ